jgi:hypothetical protein
MASIEAHSAKMLTMIFDLLIDTRNVGRRTGPHGLH